MEKSFCNRFDILTAQTLEDEKSFEQWTRTKPYISLKTKLQLPQHNQINGSLRSDFNDRVEKLLKTPPMIHKSALVPAAPTKKKLQFMNSELKPKKLTYKDEESYKINDDDSGVVFVSDCSINTNDNSEICSTTKCNIFNSDKSLENVSKLKQVVTQDTNLMNGPNITKSKIKKAELNNKVNKNNIPRIQHIVETCRNAKKNSITKNICIKKSTDYSKKNLNTCEKKESEINNPYIKENCHNHNMQLSQYNGTEQWQEKLQWLQPRRDIGMWIKCCQKNCKKWRYTEDYHDPLDVPINWYCEMNSNTEIASCTIPEVPKTPEIEADLIENKYNAGSIVWAKRDTHSWWPAMVDDCPFTFQYYKLKENSIIPVMYHVMFFDEEELVHSWHKCENIKRFTINKSNEFLEKANCNTIHASKLRKSYHLAYSAMSMTILERLRRYSFLARYELDKNNNAISIINHKNINEETVKTILYNNNKRLSTISLTDIIDINEIIPSSQPELDTTIKLKKRKTQI